MGEALAVGIVFGGLVGVVLGLIVLGIGMSKNKAGLAVGGFFTVLVAGMMLGFIGALPAFLIFLFAINSSSKTS